MRNGAHAFSDYRCIIPDLYGVSTRVSAVLVKTMDESAAGLKSLPIAAMSSDDMDIGSSIGSPTISTGTMTARSSHRFSPIG